MSHQLGNVSIQHMGSFWCHVTDTKGAISLVNLLNKFILILFHSHLGMWYSKVVAEPQE